MGKFAGDSPCSAVPQFLLLQSLEATKDDTKVKSFSSHFLTVMNADWQVKRRKL